MYSSWKSTEHGQCSLSLRHIEPNQQTRSCRVLYIDKISIFKGKELNDYFVEKYHPTKEAPSQFVDTVILNAKENGKQEPIISAYILAGNIYVGIDLNTGFFQVECEDIDKMKIIWDDLFIVRGLSEEDIENLIRLTDYTRCV